MQKMNVTSGSKLQTEKCVWYSRPGDTCKPPAIPPPSYDYADRFAGAVL